MGKIRKNYTASFKAKVVLEAVKKEKMISQLSSEYGGPYPSKKLGVMTGKIIEVSILPTNSFEEP